MHQPCHLSRALLGLTYEKSPEAKSEGGEEHLLGKVGSALLVYIYYYWCISTCVYLPCIHLLSRREEYTRVYTTVYPRVHNSVHACTLLRSRYILGRALS